MSIERRFIKGASIQTRSGEKPGIAGVGVVYDQVYDNGWFREIVKPGACARVLSEKQDVRCMFNHDVNQLLGRTKSGTLRLQDSAEGFSFDCDTDPNTGPGRDVPAMIDRGDIDGCSFSFNVRKDTWSDEFDAAGRYVATTRSIEDIDMFDIGPVTFPAYTQTSVGARSAWPDGIAAERRSHIEEMRRASAVAPPGARRADEATCECNCARCQDGDCENCDNADCDDPNCLCPYSQDRALALRARAYVKPGPRLVA
jgi:Escherichia/Staphylococcus phage prohead protease